MRVLFVTVLALLAAACASERLSLNPPPGVDLSGQWKLDEADSDDPAHLLAPARERPLNLDSPPQGRSRRGGGAQAPMPISGGPPPPSVGMMNGPLRFPGKQLEIKQVAGVVAFSSDGRNRVCQPGGARRKPKPDYRDREPAAGGREGGAPPVCGWLDAALIVKGSEMDDDRPQYEEQYTLSNDRLRLVETVTFIRGRSNGFTLSRVWERVSPQ